MTVLSSRLNKIFAGSDMLSVIAAIASISAVGTGIGLSFPLLTLLMEQRDIPASIIGANTAIAGIGAMVSVPFVTPIARKLGVVNTMLASIVVTVICLFGFYATAYMPAWFILRFIFSCALTCTFILSEFWINSASKDTSRGLILGIYATFLSLGFAFGPGILSIIGTSGILPFMFGGGIIIIATLPAWVARQGQPEMERTGKTPSIIPYIFIVPLATMAGFVFGATEQIELAFLPVFAIRSGYDEQVAALLLTIVGLGNVALQIPLGIWSDRVKDRRTVLLFCTLAGLAGAILIPLTVHVGWALSIVLFIYGGIISGMYTVGLAHMGSRLKGTDLAQANAAFVLCYGLGMTLGPQAAGILIDSFGPNGFGISLFIFFGFYLAIYTIRVGRKQPATKS